MRNAVILSASAAILAILLSGCMAKRTLTQTPRSGIEQLLLAGAAERAVNRLKGPDLRGAHVSLEVAGMTKDADFAKEAVASELQSRGAVIVPEGIKATHIVKILVLALGTDQSETFIGIPAMNSFLLPIPEITFFRRQRQTARSRLRFTVIEARTGRMVGKAEEVDGETAFSRLTILPLVFEWSDIDDRPRGRKEARRVPMLSDPGATGRPSATSWCGDLPAGRANGYESGPSGPQVLKERSNAEQGE